MADGFGIGARDLLLGLFLAVALISIYFAPTIRAMQVGHKSATAIVLLNLFAGRLIVPWIIALLWSFKSPK